jgi:lipopolysaccharide biosynthesis regulator YciM
LLSLLERSRDWRAAIEVALQLEQAGTRRLPDGSRTTGARSRSRPTRAARPSTADAAIAHAREASPLAARPLIIAGQRALQRNEAAQALQLWGGLMATSRPRSTSWRATTPRRPPRPARPAAHASAC